VGLSRTADLVGHASVEQTRKYDRTKQLSLVAEAARITENTIEPSALCRGGVGRRRERARAAASAGTRGRGKV